MTEHNLNLPEMTEAELKVSTKNMFKLGGAENVLSCVLMLQKCQIVILRKLNDLLNGEEI